MLVKLIISFILLIIIPELIGLLFLNFWKKEKNNIIFAFPIGYAVEFAIAQIFTVPMIFLEKSYNSLLYDFYITICILTVISIVVNRKNIKDIFEIIHKKINELPKVITILVILIIGIQLYMFIGNYTYVNDDDAYYVGTATTTIATNTIFKYSPTTGNTSGEHNDLRYKLGPFPVYYALVSSVLNISPAIVAHIILPIVFIISIYCIYYVLAYEFFDGNIEKTSLFVLIMGVINIFGNYAEKSTFSYMLLRIWQGKALLSNFIIPLILILMLKAEKENYEIIALVLLAITVTAGVFTTTMGIALPIIVIGVLGLCFGIKDKNIKNIFKCFLCCIPALIYGSIYFL